MGLRHYFSETLKIGELGKLRSRGQVYPAGEPPDLL